MMKEYDVKAKLSKYMVCVDDKTDILEIWADCIVIDQGALSFVREHQTVAEFKTWRYWKCQEKIQPPMDYKV
jgi:hypothetical protein